MGDDLVADGRNKNGTGSVHAIFFTEMIKQSRKIGVKTVCLMRARNIDEDL